MFNLDETIASSVLYFKTAKDIWKDLEARFGLVSITQVYSLQQQLADISQGKQTVSEFYTAIKAIWDRLDDVDPIPQNTACNCDLSQQVEQRLQKHRLVEFLMKLNDQFSIVRGHILLMTPTPTVQQA